MIFWSFFLLLCLGSILLVQFYIVCTSRLCVCVYACMFGRIIYLFSPGLISAVKEMILWLKYVANDEIKLMTNLKAKIKREKV